MTTPVVERLKKRGFKKNRTARFDYAPTCGVRIRKYPHRYVCPHILWNECYPGIAWAAWWVGWTNPVYKKRGW